MFQPFVQARKNQANGSADDGDAVDGDENGEHNKGDDLEERLGGGGGDEGNDEEFDAGIGEACSSASATPGDVGHENHLHAEKILQFNTSRWNRTTFSSIPCSREGVEDEAANGSLGNDRCQVQLRIGFSISSSSIRSREGGETQ